ncbi:MFS transporter [Microbacterium kribbense]|uniref:MFS transporter n=1 Tax=Microbacterium kribbense TaxID=433645 RepID=A0ABP7GM68_9MICO
MVDSLRVSVPFRLLWISSVCFFGGVWTQTMILGWMVYELTGSALQLALFTTFRFAPLLLGPMWGMLSDRFDRRRLVVVANTLPLIAIVAVATAAFAGAAGIGVLMAAGLVLGLAQAPAQPARAALVFDLVGRENISNANALNVLAMSGSQMVGPAVGGALVGVLGAPAALALSSVWYVIALVALWRMRTTTSGVAAHHESPWRMVIGGFATIGRNPVALSVMLITLFANMLLWPVFQSFMPVFAERILRLDAAGLGAMLTCAGLGGMIGSIVIAMLGDVPGKGAIFAGGTALWGVFWALFALSDQPWLSFLLLCGIGLASAPFGVFQTTLLLMATPPGVQGRALGVQELAIGMTPVAAAGLGMIAQAVGVAATTFFCAAMLIACVALVVLAMPQLLRYHGRELP